MKPPTSNLLAVLGILLGFLIFVGSITFQSVLIVPLPCTGTYCATPVPAQVAYENLVRTLAWVSIIVFDLSVALTIMFAFVLAGRSDLPETTRRSVFLFATVYLAAFLVFGLLELPSLLSFVRYV